MTDNLILRIFDDTFYVLEVNHNDSKIIVTPTNRKSEIHIISWLQLISEDKLAERDWSLPGVIYNEWDSKYLGELKPVQIRRDDSEHVGITLTYEEIV